MPSPAPPSIIGSVESTPVSNVSECSIKDHTDEPINAPIADDEINEEEEEDDS